ncbi:MAG: hypothetical protein C6H99_07075 [Epsilonproteobacteria bacterium]|nr:hypothetical protein [Campylobacterota bacterium]NPA64648.1 HEPN domain-containing protein [Campylobacterota bacterium]
MPNRTYANEWITKACRNLKAAQLLFKNDFYTDVIGVELHYALEKLFKTILAYHNKKILKIHDLVELYEAVKDEIGPLDEDVLLEMNSYFKDERYPNVVYELPSKEGIERGLDLAVKLFDKVCQKYQLDCKDCR